MRHRPWRSDARWLMTYLAWGVVVTAVILTAVNPPR
jgi:hypothetical protein